MTTNPSHEAQPALIGYLAEEVRAIVARRRVRQRELAELFGIGQAQVSARMNGHVPFTIEDIVALAHFLDTTPGALLQTAVDNMTAEMQNTPDLSIGGVSSVRHQGLEPRTRCLRDGAVVSTGSQLLEDEGSTLLDFPLADGANGETRESAGGTVTHMPLVSGRPDAPERDRLATVVLHPAAYAALTDRSAS